MLKRFPAYGRPRDEAPPFSETLRYHIVGRIHAGWLRPGDRLPSIRDVAARSEVDHRVAAEAYRELEREGLVEVRPKSGVFVSPSLSPAAADSPDGSWVAEVLFEAWQRGISRSSVCGLLGGMLSSPIRAGCIESNEDHMVALTGEVSDGLSLETVPIYVDASATDDGPVPEELVDVDVVVTTVFHSRYARGVAERAGKPLAVLTMRKEFTEEVGRRLAAGRVTAVIADPRYAVMGRAFFMAAGYAPPLRWLLVEDALREGIDLESASVLVTRAARRRLGMEEYHLIPGSAVSPESARALCELVTRVSPRRRPRLKLDPAPALRARPPGRGGPAALARPALRQEGERSEVVEEVEWTLREGKGLFEALRVLNRSTRHRFTGIYRFEPEWVRSHALFDRENPDLRIGADVPLRESYCALIAESGEHFRVEDAAADPRLTTHPSRTRILCYCGVPLMAPDGGPWGALCHYDFRPAEVPAETLAVLEAVGPLVQEAIFAGAAAGARNEAGEPLPAPPHHRRPPARSASG